MDVDFHGTNARNANTESMLTKNTIHQKQTNAFCVWMTITQTIFIQSNPNFEVTLLKVCKLEMTLWMVMNQSGR